MRSLQQRVRLGRDHLVGFPILRAMRDLHTLLPISSAVSAATKRQRRNFGVALGRCAMGTSMPAGKPRNATSTYSEREFEDGPRFQGSWQVGSHGRRICTRS